MIVKKTEQGFIALISAVIIAALLLTLTLAVSTTGFFGRFNVLDSESKERSSALAESCGDAAILDIAQNTIPATFPNSVTVIGSDKCDIVAMNQNVPVSGEVTIKTQAVFNKAFTNLLIVIDANTYNQISWQECTNFTNSLSTC